MTVAQRMRAHVVQLNCSLAATVHKKITMNRVELRAGDDFSQFLHVRRLDVHDILHRNQQRDELIRSK